MWGGMMPIGSSSMPSPSAAAIRGREDVAIGDVGWEDRQEGPSTGGPKAESSHGQADAVDRIVVNGGAGGG